MLPKATGQLKQIKEERLRLHFSHRNDILVLILLN